MRVAFKINLLVFFVLFLQCRLVSNSVLAPGNLSGFVLNYYGVAIAGATIGLEDGPVTLSGPDGYYILEGVLSGEQTIGCGKVGYNKSFTTITIPSGDTTVYNFTLTQPNIVVSPLLIEEVLNPGEYFTTSISVLNNGSGPLAWNAAIDYITSPLKNMNQNPGSVIDGMDWLTMDYYADSVYPFGDVSIVPLHLNAAGTGSGDIYEAEINFNSIPNVGQITVPVTMIVMGSQISAPENLSTELIDPVNGKVSLNWDWSGDAFQFFIVKRDGSIIATTTQPSFMDILGDHGVFCYTVQAVYNEGSSAPAGPECVEWPDPVLVVEPDTLESWVWAGFTKCVTTTISNPGEGTLSFSFPEIVAKNRVNRADPGQVLGAGGPDQFGYIWIDSDEEGGPLFNYRDISATGTPVFGVADDNIVGPFEIGFDFYFYGESKTQFWLNSNGCIGFTPNYITLGNTSLPSNSSFYIDFIAWMWDDLVFRAGTSQVFYQTFPDRLIIQFKNYEHFGQPNLFINAEVVIFRNGRVRILYDDLAAGVTLNSCTVGIQSSHPDIGLQVTFNSNYLHNDLAVLFSVPGEFITDVQPAAGIIPEGESETIIITYDSKEYVPGSYWQDLVLESNDLNNPGKIIDNTMYVYLPAIFYGQVTDKDNDEAIAGVRITAGPYQAATGENGEYTLYVDEGSYDVVFEKLGYLTVVVEDTMAFRDNETLLNTGMWDRNYRPGFVQAQVMNEDSLCELSWNVPEGPYEIAMDDGEADDYFIWSGTGNMNAVKFTPSAYPCMVTGGQIYSGDGGFPGPFTGTSFSVIVFDDNGQNGLPGTMLDSASVTVNNYGWITFDGLSAGISEGSFYLAMLQTAPSPNSAPIGIDTDNPVFFRSYTYIKDSPGWVLSPLQDLMIRAWVTGPEGDPGSRNNDEKVWRYLPKIPSGWKNFAATASGKLPLVIPGYERNDLIYKRVEGREIRNVSSYRIVRFAEFDPEGSPLEGTMTELASVTSLTFTDEEFGDLPQGWYAYGVKALYTSGLYSEYSISNIVGHLMDYQVDVSISLSTGLPPLNAEIKLQGMEYPYQTFTLNTPENGQVTFNQVWKGHYKLTARKIGYDPEVIDDVNIHSDKNFHLILSEKKYPPGCLYVDPLSLEATWCKPLRTALVQDFEGHEFPPAGWQAMTSGEMNGWQRSMDASSKNWVIPLWDSYYAVSNDDAAGSEGDGCCDYLITPSMDLRESGNYVLSFDTYYDGAFGELAFIEYSVDMGASWTVLHQLDPMTRWTEIEIELDSLCGSEGTSDVLLAFHADDAGLYASGWAIDNVLVQVPDPAAGYIDFSIFLDNAFIGSTTVTDWNFAPLAYGQTYTVSVAAHYSSGLSSKVYYTFVCKYLVPPDNLSGDAPDDAAILRWDPPDSPVPFNLYGYNIYRNDVFVEYVPHVGGFEPQIYFEEEMQPGIYSYSVTGVYDLNPYGFPGETGESMKEGPVQVFVDYCNDLEFVETWAIGSFDEDIWLADGVNWSINGGAGNPPPAAEFSGLPAQSDYEIALESYPLCAYGITEGKIWVDFDISLFSFQHTGNEFMKLQVWDWISQSWHTAAEYSNYDGNFDWKAEHIDVSEFAIDKIFKIRFVASGIQSHNIRGWFVDNIHVYRLCTAPQQLMIDPYYYDGIHLMWESGLSDKDEIRGNGRDLTAYRVFRSENGQDFQMIAEVESAEFYDPGSDLSMGSTYCYKINAIWQGVADQCESAFSNEECVTWTGIGNHDPDLLNNLYLFPNPANDYVKIKVTDDRLERIAIYNTLGQMLIAENIAGDEYFLTTSSLPPGTYLLRIETLKGITSRLLAVRR